MSSSYGLRYEEYYICCNPPLLPLGVSEIISSAYDTLENLLEILYEPDGPWFKLISEQSHREEITNFVQDAVVLHGKDAKIATSGSTTRESNPVRQDPERSDVDVLSEVPRLVPWSNYVSGNIEAEQYDEFRFPSSLVQTPYKSVWNKVGNIPVKDLDELFRRTAKTWMAQDIPSGTEDAEEKLGCKIDWNLRRTIFYISSQTSKATVDTAVRKLDTAVDVLFSTQSLFQRHVVAVNDDVKLGYKWLTHLGLVNTAHLAVSDSHVRGAVLRAAEKSKEGGFRIIDGDSSAKQETKSRDLASTFSAFSGYTYRTKRPDQETAAITASDIARPLRKRQCENYSFKSRYKNRIPVPTPSKSNISAPSLSPDVEAWINNVRIANIRKNEQNEVPSPTKDSPTPKTEKILPSGLHGSVKGSLGPIEPPGALIEVDVGAHVPQTAYAGEHEEDLFDRLIQEHEDNLSSYEALAEFQNHHNEVDLIDFTEDDCSLKTCGGVLESPPPKSSLKERQKDAVPTQEVLLFGLEPESPKDIRRTMRQQAGFKAPRPSERIQGLEERTARESKSRTPVHGSCSNSVHEETVLVASNDSGIVKSRAGMLGTRTASSNSQPILKWSDHFKNNPTRLPRTGNPTPEELTWRNNDCGKAADLTKSVKTPMNGIPAAEGTNPKWPAQPLPRGGKTSHDHNGEDVSQHRVSGSILANILKNVHNMARSLRVVPGEVHLELKFGLIWFRNLSEADVNTNGTRPLWCSASIQHELSNTSPQEDIMFQGFISSKGVDANNLARMQLLGGSGWEEPELETRYEFSCRESMTRFKIVVDAQSFTYACVGPDEEVAGTYIHCPRNIWDIKIRAWRSCSTHVPNMCEEIARKLVSSMAISIRDGEVTIVATVPRESGVLFEKAEARHIARYKDRVKDDRLLTIIMTRPLQQSVYCHRGGDTLQWKSRIAPSQWGDATPGQFFEASLSSCHAEKLFQQNAKLEFGEAVAWTANDVQQKCSFEDLCHLALGMVGKMDSLSLSDGMDTPGGYW